MFSTLIAQTIPGNTRRLPYFTAGFLWYDNYCQQWAGEYCYCYSHSRCADSLDAIVCL